MTDKKKTYEEAVADLSLMLMYLTRQQEKREYGKYRELSWKGYEFDVMGRLEDEELLWQPKGRRGYEKYLYLTEAGRKRAKELLEQYGLPDQGWKERFDFRTILAEEAAQAAEIEQICFPPNEACTEKIMRERIAVASDLFLVAVEKKSGKIVGFLNGLATDENTFRDDFFTDPSLHKPDGDNVLLLGLDVLPEYRNQGLAHEIMYQYLRREWERNRKTILLTCLEEKVTLYESMGFRDLGLADSSWGGEAWHEMSCVLNL